MYRGFIRLAIPQALKEQLHYYRLMAEKKSSPDRAKTVLIVDDAPGMRLMIKSYLEPEGYDILQADNAETALRLCKEQRVDLIILDMMLPGNMMGSDVLIRLRKKSSTANTPVITISGLPAYEDGIQTIDPNVTFLPKPFDKEKFMQVVSNLM
jgi:two-component system, cell cycle response regulator